MNKQQLAATIWRGANKLRGKIEASEYKNYILGFIFYKFLSDKEEKFLFDRHWEKDDLVELTDDAAEHKKLCQDNIGYYISYENLFSHWIKEGKDFDAGQVTTALNAFERNINQDPKTGFKPIYQNIFKTLRNNLSGLGSNNQEITKAVIDILSLVQKIPMDDKQGYDVLGFIYEYLIGMFAANAGKKAGEFYTPHEVSVLMSEIVAHHLKGREKISIYDPTSGSGSLLINIGKSISKFMPGENNIKYYAQELIEPTHNLTRMNLIMRGILPSNIETRNGDSLAEDWPLVKKEENGVERFDPLWLDAVVSNPPYSQSWTPHDDPRFDEFGLAPKGKADYAFLLHDLYHIKNDGIMTIVLPHGVLSRGTFNKENPDESQDESKIRYKLVEKNRIDCIIGLPPNIFFGTGIPTIIMVLKKEKEDDNILFVDASKGFVKNSKKNALRSRDIRKIADIVINKEEVKNFSRLVSREEIRRNNYVLNIPRYVDNGDRNENWDLYSIMNGGIPNYELDDLGSYWEVFKSLRDELFAPINDSYSAIKEINVPRTINDNAYVKAFVKDYKNAFSDFDKYLEDNLISKIENLNVASTETAIAANITQRLMEFSLVDKYAAYQLFSDVWTVISSDLEMIQSEGFECVYKVDPNMVPNKKEKDGEDVLDGYVGHIIPFEIAKKCILTNDYNQIIALQEKLSDISEQYSVILDDLSEEEKEGDFVNEEKDGFDFKYIASESKKIKKSGAALDRINKYIIELAGLNEEEKKAKKELKTKNAKIEEDAKNVIENLDRETALKLLRVKWIVPLIDNINQLPSIIIDELINKINYFVGKYIITLSGTQEQLAENETELISLLRDLNAKDYDSKGISDFISVLGGKKQ